MTGLALAAIALLSPLLYAALLGLWCALRGHDETDIDLCRYCHTCGRVRPDEARRTWGRRLVRLLAREHRLLTREIARRAKGT